MLQPPRAWCCVAPVSAVISTAKATKIRVARTKWTHACRKCRQFQPVEIVACKCSTQTNNADEILLLLHIFLCVYIYVYSCTSFLAAWFHVDCVIKTDVNHTLSKPAIADGHRRFGQNVQVIELTWVWGPALGLWVSKPARHKYMYAYIHILLLAGRQSVIVVMSKRNCHIGFDMFFNTNFTRIFRNRQLHQQLSSFFERRHVRSPMQLKWSWELDLKLNSVAVAWSTISYHAPSPRPAPHFPRYEHTYVHTRTHVRRTALAVPKQAVKLLFQQQQHQGAPFGCMQYCHHINVLAFCGQYLWLCACRTIWRPGPWDFDVRLPLGWLSWLSWLVWKVKNK